MPPPTPSAPPPPPAPLPNILAYAKPPARDDSLRRMVIALGCTVFTAALFVPVVTKVRHHPYPVRPLTATTSPATTNPTDPIAPVAQ